MNGPRLRIQAVEQATKVRYVKQVILDRHRATTTVHLLFEINFTIIILVEITIVPDHGRILVITSCLAIFFDDSL